MNELPHFNGIKAASPPENLAADWLSIAIAPFDLDLELAVIDAEGPHALVFPCRRGFPGWVKAGTNERVDVRPTHWRQWNSTPFGVS